MQCILVFRLGVIMVYIISKSEVPALTFRPNNPGMGVNILLDVCAQYHSIDHEFLAWKSGRSFKYGCNSLHNLVMTTLRCCQLPFFFAWLLCLQPFWDAVSAVHCVLGRTADFRGELRTVRTVEDSIRGASCKVWHVKTVWNTGRKKVLWRKWWRQMTVNGRKLQVYHLGKRLVNVRR